MPIYLLDLMYRIIQKIFFIFCDYLFFYKARKHRTPPLTFREPVISFLTGNKMLKRAHYWY